MKREIPSIKTDRLLLRNITESDLNSIYTGLSNPEVIKHYGISFDSLEATKEQMNWFLESKQYWWAICSTDNEIFYGAGGLNDISIEHQKAEIGLWLLPEFWNQGIMTEILPLICNYGFDQLGLHRIEGFVESNNLNCKKALAKLDFQHEGTMKDCEIKNERFINIDIYAKLKSI